MCLYYMKLLYAYFAVFTRKNSAHGSTTDGQQKKSAPGNLLAPSLVFTRYKDVFLNILISRDKRMIKIYIFLWTPMQKTHLFGDVLFWFRHVIVIVPRHVVCHFYCLELHVWTLKNKKKDIQRKLIKHTVDNALQI